MFQFPETPKVNLPNFLTGLDKGIKIIDKNLLLLEIHKKEKLNFREAAAKLKINESSYKRYVKGLAPCPLAFFIKFCNNFKAKDTYEKFFSDELALTTKKERVTLPTKITPKLSYFVGYLYGDGYIGSDKKRVGFIEEDIEQIKLINEISKSLFNSNGKIRKRRTFKSKKDCYDLTIKRNVLNSFLCNVFGMKRGKKTDLKIPSQIKQNKELLRWFLRGLFDADGTLPRKPKKTVQQFIDVSQKELKFIIEIKEALNSFRIETHKPYARKSVSPTTGNPTITWELRIRKREIIKKFLKEIGFVHPVKNKRAIELLNYLEEPVA